MTKPADDEEFRFVDLTDQELLVKQQEQIQSEKDIVAAWLSDGEFYIMSAGRVHLPTCRRVAREMDRDVAWKPYTADLSDIREYSGTGNQPGMPWLLKRAEVEGICRPTRRVKPAARRWTMSSSNVDKSANPLLTAAYRSRVASLAGVALRATKYTLLLRGGL